MGESNNTGSEWYIWFFGGILAIGLLGRLTMGVGDFMANDSGEPNQVEVVSNTEVPTPDVQEDSVEFISRISDSVLEALSNFSIFDSMPWLVYFSAIVSVLALVVALYSQLRRKWLISEWDKVIGISGSSDAESNTINTTEIAKPELLESNNDEIVNTDADDFSLNNIENSNWERVKDLATSDDESKWRQAIIEADIMLDELLSNLNYDGKTVAEKLQQIRPTDMETLSDAWEAHKIRNRVAHEGNSFNLDHDLALKTIARFERVFRENYIIS